MYLKSVERQEETQVRKVSDTWANFKKGQFDAFPGVSQMEMEVALMVVVFTYPHELTHELYQQETEETFLIYWKELRGNMRAWEQPTSSTSLQLSLTW